MERIILYDATKRGLNVNVDLEHLDGLWTQYVIQWGDKDLERITISKNETISHKYNYRTTYTIKVKRL